MANSTGSFTVQPNGQTLVVSATVGGGVAAGAAVLYSEATLDNVVTQPVTVTADRTFYVPVPGVYTVSATQPDGSELWGKSYNLDVGVSVTVAPLPSTAQAAADVRPPTFSYISGQYYIAGQPVAGSTKVADLSYAVASLYYIPETLSIAKIGAEVTSAGSAGAVLRLGVWAHSTSTGGPTTLISDCGTIDGTSATVQDITLGSALVLKPGAYWFGGASQVAACTYRSTAAATTHYGTPLGASIPTANLAGGAYAVSGATGAFAATFGTLIASAMATAPRIHFKVS